MFSKSILFLALLPLFTQAQLTAFEEEWKNDKDLKNASVGYCVMNAASSEVLAEYNSRQLLVPASTLKIVTTSAALSLLGANYKYETRIYYNGEYNKTSGVLNGDLIILGSGDPTLQSDNFSKDNTSVTDSWAKILKEKGLKEIKGNIIGDASYFERKIPSNWIWEDISNYYGAVPCGLSYHDNKFKVRYTTKENGSSAKIVDYSPAYLSNSITLVSDVTSQGTQDEAYAYGDPFSFTKEIHGTLPPNKTNYEIEVVLPDPALLCAENLYTSLQKIGIKCKTKSTHSNYKKTEQNLGDLIYTHFSPTLEKIIYFTNIKSNNHYCESLILTLGKGNAKTGLKTVQEYWVSRGLNSSEVFMDDASGLARINAISPHYQASLLSKVSKDNVNYKLFSNSLPIAGKQGSMSNLGKGKFIENNMHAKTGYITRARAYCGYVKTKSGKELSFSLIFNNYNCSVIEAKLKMEKFLVALGDL
ncbi:D-alanyl-D-alanine carboxypeptidase/D-alanyl-D-alanine endopeptidase [Aurantibacillus circumpalustris]|uniref:D-alanyl-D-alanine carboxypeptidase/D-alanyl-D-alanine endopeptidase n=1 Tax=Aurantibacillus circumpalustris TaxID=3036359 RepID=UPI00295BDF6C|nr:D-alanyl-D-alanine carboxypeptidase/D-alanyl-D-alanine-endopeptidase [Aurantibacillus circumpalustris]